MNDLKISTLGSRSSKWGEGPIYWKDHLLYVDIEGHSLIRLNPETKEEEVWGMRERIGTVVPTLGEDFICAGDSGIYRFDPSRNQKTNLADPEANKRQTIVSMMANVIPWSFLGRYNSTVKKEGDANLYQLIIRACLPCRWAEWLTRMVSVGMLQNWDVLHWYSHPKSRCYEYDDQTGNWEINVAIDFELKRGLPDGMTIDEKGMLWVALCHGGAVLM